MKFTRYELAEGITTLNNFLSYIKKVEGTPEFPVIIADWELLDERMKTIVALMSMSMLAEKLIEDNYEN